MISKFILVSLVVVCINTVNIVASQKGYFTAAVFEYPRWGDRTFAAPSYIINQNLGWYAKAAKEAKARGVDIIVYPEYGLFVPTGRASMKSYTEIVPDPKTASSNPCNEFSDQPILRNLSCLARSNEIVVVANMGGFENCTGRPRCPYDGRRNLNTNVVFDRDGTLLARYYKEHLFFEGDMDLPDTPQDPFFKTKFGKFATFVCFDSMFQKMAIVGEMQTIDAVAFPTMWVNMQPSHTSTQWWQAWAIGSNATLLAANIQIPGEAAAGSGIYSGLEGAQVSSMSHDGVPKLLIARVPNRNSKVSQKTHIIAFTQNGTQEWSDGDGPFEPTCSVSRMGLPKDIYKNYRCHEEDISNYTFVKLTQASGHLTACSKKMCCHLDYAAENMNEVFYLGVFNGTQHVLNKYFFSVETCFVARCDDVNGKPCSTYPAASTTRFRYLHLSANFTTPHIYPSVVGDQFKLLPYREWNFTKTSGASSLNFKKGVGFPLLSATLKGRVYEKDPPYIQ